MSSIETTIVGADVRVSSDSVRFIACRACHADLLFGDSAWAIAAECEAMVIGRTVSHVYFYFN